MKCAGDEVQFIPIYQFSMDIQWVSPLHPPFSSRPFQQAPWPRFGCLSCCSQKSGKRRSFDFFSEGCDRGNQEKLGELHSKTQEKVWQIHVDIDYETDTFSFSLTISLTLQYSDRFSDMCILTVTLTTILTLFPSFIWTCLQTYVLTYRLMESNMFFGQFADSFSDIYYIFQDESALFQDVIWDLRMRILNLILLRVGLVAWAITVRRNGMIHDGKID